MRRSWVMLLSLWAMGGAVTAGVARANPAAEADGDTMTAHIDTARTSAPDDFESMPDRWSIVPPPTQFTVRGRAIDPYNQNRLKGDYPIAGQNTFLILTANLGSFFEASRLPTASGVSTLEPVSEPFFGDGDRFFVSETVRLSLELFHGQTAFRPRDWEFRVAGVFNLNYVNLNENNNVNINVRKGDTRRDQHVGIQELSLEKHVFNVSDRFDFVSLRAGVQGFSSDFRGFVFSDYNLGARLLGNLSSNRFQYNAIFLEMLEKDTNSGLNTVFDDRDQQVVIANLYRQDTLRPGYAAQLSVHYNRDKASVHFDENGVPVRPALVGATRPHEIEAWYLGWAGDGHFGKFNVSHAFYQVLGSDDYNPIADREVDINAQMAALELSMDRDWQRYKASVFFASGDPEPMDDTARGFDSIVDEPFFAGGGASFWQSQGLRLQDVNLVQPGSLVPNLRSSKNEGQSNFVNPGLLIYALGYDADLTPKLKLGLNAAYVRFAYVASLEQFLQQNNIADDVGIDVGAGLTWRPLLNNNIIVNVTGSGFLPSAGFEDIYESGDFLYAIKGNLLLTY